MGRGGPVAGQFDAHERSTARARGQTQFLPGAIHGVKPAAEIGQADARAGGQLGARRQANAVILHLQREQAVLAARAYPDQARAFRRFDPVADGIFDHRLQHQRRHQALERRGLHVQLEPEAIPKARLLDLAVALHKVQFLAQRGLLPVRLAQGQAQQLAEGSQRSFRRTRVTAQQRRYRVQGIEQEMRLQLGL